MHKLSLDIVAGSVGSYAFASRIMHRPMSAKFAVLLALSVWTIYLADHFLDSRKLSSKKYLIFARYRSQFVLLLSLLATVCLVLALRFSDVRLFYYGGALGLVLAAYLTMQHFLPHQKRIFFPKEIIIALVYTAAVWFYPFSSSSFNGLQLLVMIIHFMLVLMNVGLFSYFERDDDRRDDRISFISNLGDNTLSLIIVVVGVAIVTASISIVVLKFYLPVIVPAFIAALYCAGVYFRHSLFLRKHHAELTDAAFLLFLIFAGR